MQEKAISPGDLQNEQAVGPLAQCLPRCHGLRVKTGRICARVFPGVSSKTFIAHATEPMESSHGRLRPADTCARVFVRARWRLRRCAVEEGRGRRANRGGPSQWTEPAKISNLTCKCVTCARATRAPNKQQRLQRQRGTAMCMRV
jgi:hypothetical protein